MSMLAGPRRKQKVINLRAKNNAWSNDSNKFGQRMLEKMGWSSGKGLGANENGIVEHVIAKYKNDEKGLGFEDRNDQWTKHEDDFNTLLASLSNTSSNEDQITSGVSLEDKSKKSKTRIHYHKFARGKDLSRYSEKDLANILGKRSLKNEEKSEEIIKEEVKTTDQVFTEKGSMEDYFKNKLAARKSKKNVSLESCNNDEYINSEYGFRGFSGTDNKHEEDKHEDESFEVKSFSFYPFHNNLDSSLEQLRKNEVDPCEKKKKKSKNSGQECTKSIRNSNENFCSDIKNKNKLKSNISSHSDSRDVSEKIQTVNKLQNEIDLYSGITNNKKKRSRNLEQECTKSTQNNDENVCSKVKNKKKSKLKFNPDSDAKGVTEEIPILKKSRKKKHLDSDQLTQNREDYVPKNKKCKKSKEKTT